MSGFQRPLLLFISHAISVSSKHRNKHQLSHSSLRAILLPLLLLLSQQAQHTEHDPHHWLNTQSTTHTTGSTHRARPKPLAQHTEHDPHHWLKTQSTPHTTGSTHRARLTSLAQHTEHDPHHWLNTQSTTHTTGSTRGSTIPVPYTDPPTDLNTHTYLLFLINQVQRNARNVALDLHHVIQDKVAQYSQAGSPHTCTVYIVG